MDTLSIISRNNSKLDEFVEREATQIESKLQLSNINFKSNQKLSNNFNFKKGTTTLGFVINDGLIIAVDSRSSMSSYIASQTVKKVIEINEYLLGTMAGGAADCYFWERELARLCRLYELRNKERISVAAASNLLSNIFYQYKDYGLSCGTMIAGWNNKSNSAELYYVSDDGSRIFGKIFSIGSGSTYAYGVLDNEYHENLSLSEAINLAKKSIFHATHRDGGSGGVVRVYHVHKNGWDVLEKGEDVNDVMINQCK